MITTLWPIFVSNLGAFSLLGDFQTRWSTNLSENFIPLLIRRNVGGNWKSISRPLGIRSYRWEGQTNKGGGAESIKTFWEPRLYPQFQLCLMVLSTLYHNNCQSWVWHIFFRWDYSEFRSPLAILQAHNSHPIFFLQTHSKQGLPVHRCPVLKEYKTGDLTDIHWLT